MTNVDGFARERKPHSYPWDSEDGKPLDIAGIRAAAIAAGFTRDNPAVRYRLAQIPPLSTEAMALRGLPDSKVEQARLRRLANSIEAELRAERRKAARHD